MTAKLRTHLAHPMPSYFSDEVMLVHLAVKHRVDDMYQSSSDLQAELDEVF